MKRDHSQRGAVLVVSLLLLVVVTLLAVSSIKSGTINLRIVDNMRSQQDAEAVTQEAVHVVLGDIANFNNPVSATETIDGHSVNITAPQCVQARPASGYSAKWGLAPEDTTWEFTATIADGDSGAQASIRQGVQIRMVADSCPVPP